MKQSGYLYNNEALACVAIGYFLKRHNMISIAKLLFVLPFVLHEPTVKKLRNRSYKRSLEEFILKNSDCLINFNRRFYDFMPLTINAITILKEMKVLNIKGSKIYYNHHSSFSPENYYKIGKRADDLFVAVDVLNGIMDGQDVNSFYLKLKIEI